MALTASIVFGGKKALEEIAPKPPSVPAVPEPPKFSDEQKRQAQSEAVTRQRAQAAAANGGGDTRLTGPLGLLNEPVTQRRTLLGG